jgi:hypothetical protein
MMYLTSCESQPNFEYYSFPTERDSVTLVRYDGRVYFTRGKYVKQAIPQCFIRPVSGIDNSYLCYIHWCGSEGVEILSPYGEWLDTEKDSLLRFREIDDIELNLIISDRTGKYVRCYGDAYPE